jgi:hypothetical protein
LEAEAGVLKKFLYFAAQDDDCAEDDQSEYTFLLKFYP